jgi:hypothetical protein
MVLFHARTVPKGSLHDTLCFANLAGGLGPRTLYAARTSSVVIHHFNQYSYVLFSTAAVRSIGGSF